MKGILLLSGGIDSPVCGYLMLRKGVEVVAVHMDARPHTDEAGLEKARLLAARIGDVAHRCVPLRVVPYAAFHEEAARRCKAKLHCVLCKRFMYRVASALASKERADIVVTGESLGQVASQTLANLAVLDAAADVPVVRPLIGFDKEDTIRVAREIGTFDISCARAGGCPFVPCEPSTSARMEDVLAEEAKMDIPAMVEAAISGSVLT